MNVIDVILLVLVVLESLLFVFYLINIRVKRENRIFSIICLIIIFITLFYYKSTGIFEEIINRQSLVLLIITLVSAIILKLIYINYELDRKFNKIIRYVVEYEKIIDEQGKKNHEYNNQLMILKGYVDDKTKLKEYLDTLIDDHTLGQNYKIRQLSNFPNGGLKRMLYYKISIIKEKKIKYYLYISEESAVLLENLSIKLYNDITKVFGVLIDNAIDASLKSEDKELSLDFSKEDNYIVITVSNTYDKKIDINKIGRKGFSSKGKGHGFGLRLVKEIIKRNKKIELLTEHNNRYFIQTILIDTN
jgi:two-component system sensor histidine kinase AgrC